MFAEEFYSKEKTEQIICDLPKYINQDIMLLSAEFLTGKVIGRTNRRKMLEIIIPWFLTTEFKASIKNEPWECDISEKLAYDLRSTLNIKRVNQNATISNIIQVWYNSQYSQTVKKISIVKAEQEVEEAQRVLTVALANLNKLKEVNQVPQPTPPISTQETQVDPHTKVESIPIPKATPKSPKAPITPKPKKKYVPRIKQPKYTVLKPDGTYKDITILTDFCREHDLDCNSFSKRMVAQKGKKKVQSTLNGYYVWPIGHPDIKRHKAGEFKLGIPKSNGGGVNSKQWLIIYPDGTEEKSIGLKPLCLKHGWNMNRIKRIKRGDDEIQIKEI